jgi:riboflavin kinase / FMN adenylyltransferase
MPTLAVITGAATHSGHGQGAPLGVPTLNIDATLIPKSVTHGIYACWVQIRGAMYMGALHFGPRPVFGDPTPSCEVHVLDQAFDTTPQTIDIHIFERIRDIRNFETPEAMTEEIARDIEKIRAILHP